MRYLIQPLNAPPFFSQWFYFENHYTPGMIVYDMDKIMYSKDGETWEKIEEDHL